MVKQPWPEVTDLVAVGSVTSGGVRLWVRSSAPGALTLLLSEEPGDTSSWGIEQESRQLRDGTTSFAYPEDFTGAPQLRSGQRYTFRVERTNTKGQRALVGQGRFETAPHDDSSAPFSFAMMSCHQPFLADGTIAPRAAAMLDRLEATLDAHRVKYLLLMGDQIYADNPHTASLFGPHGALSRFPDVARSEEEIRTAFQLRYRQCLTSRYAALQARWPTHCVLDDHEVIDNWGSEPDHTTSAWRELCRVARDVGFDYQLSRNVNETRRNAASHHYTFRFGRTATFCADLRSERWVEAGRGSILSEAQFAALSAFLEGHDDCTALFLVLSVPLVFLPDWLVNSGARLTSSSSLFDQWNWRGFQEDHHRLVDLLLAHRASRPQQQLALLSGDVHQAYASTLRTGPSAATVQQFVSSPVASASTALVEHVAHRASGLTRSLSHRDRRLRVEQRTSVNQPTTTPIATPNIGIVQVDPAPDAPSLRFQVLSPRAGNEQLSVVFDTGALGTHD